jgi:hypothetical protein
VPSAIGHIHPVKDMNTAALTERMVSDGIVSLILRQCGFIGMEQELFGADLEEPKSQPAAETAVTFRCAQTEIDLGLESYRFAMTRSKVRFQHVALAFDV